MKKKISVIVPIYMVEQYLPRCVNSIINQSYKNIEIILVDDGSLDKCPEICDELAKKDIRIKVIHKENGGLSSARNAGLLAATGDFVTFIDSDDWIALDTFEYGISLIDKYNADAFEYEYVYMSSELKKIKQSKEHCCVYKGKDILQYFMTSTTVRGNYSVCICIFKKIILDGIFFREGKIAEDGDFKYRAYSCCNTLIYSNQKKYFYFQSGNSISTGGLKLKDFQLYEAAEELYSLTKDETYGSIAKLGYVKKCRTAMSLLCRIVLYGFSDSKINKKETIDKLVKENRENLLVLLDSPMPLSRKVVSCMFAINYRLTRYIMRLLNKLL